MLRRKAEEEAMADIKQAAKWMNDGKRVTRRIWPNKSYLIRNDGGFGHEEPDEMPHWHKWIKLNLDDLLGEDWKIVE